MALRKPRSMERAAKVPSLTFCMLSGGKTKMNEIRIFHLRMMVRHLAHTLCTSSLSKHKKDAVSSGFDDIPQSG